MGFAGAMISIYPPEGKGYYAPEYEPFWAAAQDLGMPVGLHLGTNRPGVGEDAQHLKGGEVGRPGPALGDAQRGTTGRACLLPT